MMECEFNPAHPIELGELLLHDVTSYGARHRSPVDFTISGSLSEIDSESRKIELNCNSILMVHQGQEYPLDKGLVLTRQIWLDDIRIPLRLDMSKLSPVYAPTEFELHVSIKIDSDEEESKSHEDCTVRFQIHENRQDAHLRLRSCIGNGVSWKECPCAESEDIRATDLTGNQIIKKEVGREILFSLAMRNTATVPNGDPASNYVYVKELYIRPDAGTDYALLSSVLRLQVNGHWKELNEDQRSPIGMGVSIKAEGADKHREKPDKHVLQLYIVHDAKLECFRGQNGGRQYGLVLELHYNELNQDSSAAPGMRLEKKCYIPLRFKLQENYAKHVIAVDFGTSAISMAHNIRTEDRHQEFTLLPLGRLWKRNNSSLTPLESSENAISSVIQYEHHNKFTIPISEESFVAPQAKLAAINYLKSYIGSCQMYIHPLAKDGTIVDEVPTRLAVQEIYHQLYEAYGKPALQTQPSQSSGFSRMVITHPNSYMDGQIQFLKDAIQEELWAEIPDIQAISESDAVVYAYLRDENVAGDNAFILRSRGLNQAESVFEHIMCFDMGAGTVDISYRKIEYRVTHDGDLYLNEISENKHELLGLVSVNGAGNALDKNIAMIIDDFLISLQEFMQDTDITLRVMPCMKPATLSEQEERVTEGGMAQQAPNDLPQGQINLLLNLKLNIAKAKTKIDDSSEFLEVELPSQGAVQATPFLYVSDIDKFRPQLEEVNKNRRDGVSLSCDEFGTKFKIKIPTKTIEQHLEKQFFTTQVVHPVEAALGVTSEEKASVDTVLITGRGTLYPAVQKRIQEEILKRCISEPVFIMFADNDDKLKSLVAEGALRWGTESLSDRALFEPPKMIGAIGVAWRQNRQWRGKILLTKEEVLNKLGNQEWSENTSFLVTACSNLVFFHTTLNKDFLIARELQALTDNQINSITDAVGMLEATGYFRVLHTIKNLRDLRNGEDETIDIAIRPVEAGGNYRQDNHNADDFSNLGITLQTGPLECDIMLGVRPQMMQHQFWPHSIFNKTDIS